MSAINLKSITGITSITTPAGVDNQLTLHTNNTTERVKINSSGNVSIANDLDVDGHTNLDNVSIAGVTTATGQLTAAGNIKISNTQPTLIFDDTNHQDFTIAAVGNALNITDANNGNRLLFNANGSNSLYGFLSITGDLSATGIYFLSDAIQHINDSDTKIRFPATDTFSVETAGSERLRITSAGKVLVGDGSSITPSRNLDVRGTGHQQILLGSTNNAGVSLMADGQGGGDGSGGLYCTFEAASDGDLKIRNYDDTKKIIFGVGSNTGSNDSVVITSSGNLLVGTTSDTQRLHVYNGSGGTGYKTALFDSNDTSNGTRVVITNSGNTSNRGLGIIVGGQAGTDRASFGWFNNNNTYVTANLMTIQSDGKIGIGRNDPVNFVDIVRGSDEENILVVRGADASSEYGALGIGGGYYYITGGGAGSTNTGIMFRTAASGNETNRLLITSSGHVEPATDDTYNFGSLTKRWANIYTADLNLSNEGKANDVDGTWGQYTIQEGKDNLYLINKRSGKKYKFLLQEVS